MTEDEYTTRRLALDRISEASQKASEIHLLTSILDIYNWEEQSRITGWLKHLYPSLYEVKESKARKMLVRLKSFLRHVKGYRIIHEDDMERY